MNIKDAYIHNGLGVLRELQVTAAGMLQLKRAAKDSNDAYVGWEDVKDLTAIKPTNAGTADSVPWTGITGKPDTFPVATHDHDDRYLKLAGNGTTNPMTGTIYIKDVDGLIINSTNKTLNIWEVYGNSGTWASQFGFNLQYYGVGSGNDNDLILWAHAQTAATHVEVFRVHQDGSFIFKAAPKVGTNAVYHAGNLTIKTLMGTTAIGDADEPVYWSGTAFVKAGAYPTKSSWNYDDVYLKLSGGTLTGDLTIKSNSGDSPKLIFQRGTLTDSLDDWRIFDTGGNLKFQHTTGSTTDWKDYVVFSATAGTVTINGNTVWHAGNDGSGSTLDADLLDGFHAADFRNNIIDLRTSPQTFNPTYLKDIVFISEADYSTLVSNGSITKNSITHTYNSSNWYVIPDKVPEYAETAGSVAWSNVTSKPATATRWPSWSEVTGKPSTFSPSSHTHYATRYKDSRNTAMTPTNAVAVDGLAIDFKTKANGVNAGSGLYCGLVTLDPYSDASGGYPMQMGFNTGADANNTNELYIRTAKDADTWNEWRTVITSANIGSQTVSSATTATYASNVGAAGTAGTNYVTAAKVIATCNWYDTMTSNTDDANDVIDRWSEIVAFVANFEETPDLATFLSNNYLALSGGTMTGPIKWTDATALPEQTSPLYFVCIDAFNSGGTTKWASKANTLKALTGLTSTAIGDSDEPIYWDGSKFVKAGAYPTKASWNYDDRYLKLSSTEQTVESTISSFSKGIVEFYRSSGDHIAFITFSNKANNAKRVLGSIGFYSGGVGKLQYRSADAKFYDIINGSNITTYVACASSAVTLSTSEQTLLTVKSGESGSLSSSTIKVKLPATSPYSYSFDDLTSHPTTLDGYGITDAVPKIKSAASAVLNVNSMLEWPGVEITTPFRWSTNNPDMFAFTVRIYNGYNYTDIVISGYCYGNSKWYLPKAEIIGGTKKYVVKFGWHDTARSESDTNKYLYVWIGCGKNANNEIIKFSYGGLSIFNVHTGHSTNLDMYKNWSAVNKSEDNLVNVQSTVNTVLPNEWSNILNKPTSFTPAAHTHYIGTTATQSSSAAQDLTGIKDSTFSGVMNITGRQSYAEGIRIHDYSGISSIWFRAVNADNYDAGMIGITADSTGLRFRLPASATGTSVADKVKIAYGGNVSVTNALTVSGAFTASAAVYFTGLTEGTSDPTDSTEILTSYASNNGFADTTGAGQVYRRKASTLYNYIKDKATGTWGISITGSAGSVAWANVSDRPDFTTWSETSSTATYSLSNATWTQTITLPTAAGSYILKLVSGNSTLTGVFSIGASDNAKDEISLHLHGNGPRLYARTNGTKLELSRNIATATNTSVTITYRRMI